MYGALINDVMKSYLTRLKQWLFCDQCRCKRFYRNTTHINEKSNRRSMQTNQTLSKSCGVDKNC